MTKKLVVILGYFIALLFIAWIIYLFVKHEKNKTYINSDTEKLKCESYIEHRLYNALKNNGYNPSTQVKVGRYRIDIAFETAKLAIEADGKAYHSSPTAKARDRRRNAFLKSHGWKVLRFSGSRIHRDIKGILIQIDQELRKRQLD